ncbi:hypothetical protein BS47DRAFT_1481974 [Hydnum rufescens UP504]|uniref:P-type Cu(+) transporter n=1 Tax=Hydnum rufescens UP504 TaxID=1448309 RepID=A0A9P6B825_9AGAM|nr:hypothetical protein BS47DRAFT_1481974 [Hydnum rufescens UP504]
MASFTSHFSAVFSNLFSRGQFPSHIKLDAPSPSENDPNDKYMPSVEKCELRIEGMTCGACVESIEGMLRDQEGIHSIRVALLAERGVVEYDSSTWTVDKIIGEISDIGFDATHIPLARSDVIMLRIYGMTCSSCTSTVETQLSAMPGINNVAVSLAAETCRVEFDCTVIGPRDMIERIEELGFDAVLAEEEGDATQLQSLTRTKEIQGWRRRLYTSASFALPVFFLSMILPMIHFLRPIYHMRLIKGIYLTDLLCLLLTIPVQFWLGARFYRAAYNSVRHGSATMDVLVVVGTTAAFAYSSINMLLAPFNSNPDYRPTTFFDTSTMLITFVSLGRYLENIAKGKTSAALTNLMKLTPSMATLYTDPPECKAEKKIGTELVQKGDTLKVVPGDRIPADGTVLRGSSSVDESAITGDTVIGGTVNGLGAFDMTVTRAGKDTALSQIVKLVEEAQTSKAPIQAFTDRVAGFFVPAVLAVALLTFVVWLVLSHVITSNNLPTVFSHPGTSKFAVCLKLCISVVVVACPCALGLSTPTAIMVGTGVGAQNGILIKGGRPLEAARHIRKIVLDKTGTVTDGRPSLVALGWASDSDVPGVAAMDVIQATSSEATSPIALSKLSADRRTARAAVLAMEILKNAFGAMNAPQAEVVDFESEPGMGIKATMSLSPSFTGGKAVAYDVYLGVAEFVSQRQGLPPSWDAFEETESALGRTVVFASISPSPGSKSKVSPVPVLALSLADAPKPKITGQAIAREVGIPAHAVWSRVTPKGKAKIIQDLIDKREGGVAMVGDGVNDSPALVAADVGIALSSGTSVAIEAADIVLMRSDLLDVVAALDLSLSIFRVIKRNLAWACLYNVLGIPLAMGIFLPWGWGLHPMTAAASMAFSSVSVVMSSLTLKWWRRPASSLMPGIAAPIEGQSMRESARGLATDVRDTIRSLIPFGKSKAPSREGYDQLPMEAI